MTNWEQLRTEIHDLRWAIEVDINGRVMLNGSAVMLLNGIHRRPDDIDGFVSTWDWFVLYETNKWELILAYGDHRIADPPIIRRRFDTPSRSYNVDLFFTWRIRELGNMDVNVQWQMAQEIDGTLCMNLAHLLAWKEELRREKDIEDVRLIREHLTASRPT